MVRVSSDHDPTATIRRVTAGADPQIDAIAKRQQMILPMWVSERLLLFKNTAHNEDHPHPQAVAGRLRAPYRLGRVQGARAAAPLCLQLVLFSAVSGRPAVAASVAAATKRTALSLQLCYVWRRAVLGAPARLSSPPNGAPSCQAACTTSSRHIVHSSK